MSARNSPKDGVQLSSAVSGDACQPSIPSISTLAWIERIMKFDSTSRNSNLGLIEEVRDELLKLSFVCDLIYDASSSKANLLASLPDADGRRDGGVCFSGHVDTVPIDGQAWSYQPFAATIHDDRLYGRGACDMKGFVGTAIAVAAAQASAPRTSALHLALSYDEEVGCAGVPSLVQHMTDRGIKPVGCLVGEPTMMQVVCAHKGANVVQSQFTGIARHSSRAPEGVNAIEHAASLISHIRDLARTFAAEGPFSEGFDVPYTTLQTGVVSGGIAVNTVPASCELIFEIRNLPGVDPEAILGRIDTFVQHEVLPAMRGTAGAGDVRMKLLASAPAFEADEESDFTRLVRCVAADDAFRRVAYATEAGFFHRAGIPTIVCGPGDIAQAHTADEFVSLPQIARCENMLNTLINAHA